MGNTENKEVKKSTFAEKADFFFNKLIPKKMIVWVVATVLCFTGKVPGELWAYISMVYLGVNIAGKFAYAITKNEAFKYVEETEGKKEGEE